MTKPIFAPLPVPFTLIVHDHSQSVMLHETWGPLETSSDRYELYRSIEGATVLIKTADLPSILPTDKLPAPIPPNSVPVVDEFAEAIDRMLDDPPT